MVDRLLERSRELEVSNELPAVSEASEARMFPSGLSVVLAGSDKLTCVLREAVYLQQPHMSRFSVIFGRIR